MKIGDKRAHKVIEFTGNHKKDVLAVFNQLTDQDEEKKLLELKRKQREVNEAAKRLF